MGPQNSGLCRQVVNIRKVWLYLNRALSYVAERTFAKVSIGDTFFVPMVKKDGVKGYYMGFLHWPFYRVSFHSKILPYIYASKDVVKRWTPPRVDFIKMFTHSFYTCRSQKHIKTITTSVSFWTFGIFECKKQLVKCLWNWPLITLEEKISF